MSQTRGFPPTDLKKYPSRCPLCGGPIIEQIVTLSYDQPDGTVRLVHGVPAGVCDVCGERYLRPEVTTAIEGLLNDPPERHEQVPSRDRRQALTSCSRAAMGPRAIKSQVEMISTVSNSKAQVVTIVVRSGRSM